MTTPCDTVFLLGAGASKAAGVPDTWEFVERFEESVRGTANDAALKSILGPLRVRNPAGVDVELLLEAMTRLDEFDKDPLQAFGTSIGPDATALVESARVLIPLLRDFIKEATYVDRERIDYLDSLIDFVTEFGSLDIGTLNYDTAIEELAARRRVPVHDGFEDEWKPGSLAAAADGVRLYKLHGSTTWYATKDGRYLKSTSRQDRSEVTFVGAGRTDSLLFYPMRKWAYSEPMVGVLQEFKRRIERPETHFLVVIGYSFRDQHVHGVIRDSLRNNPRLELVLLNPDAGNILDREVLRGASDERRRELRYRTLCLPISVEHGLSTLKHEILMRMRDGTTAEAIANRQRASSGQAFFSRSIREFGRALHTHRVRLIQTFPSQDTIDRDGRLDIELRTRTAELACSPADRRTALLLELCVVLDDVLVAGTYASVAGDQPIVTLEFRPTLHQSRTQPAMGKALAELANDIERIAVLVGGGEHVIRVVSCLRALYDLWGMADSTGTELKFIVSSMEPDDPSTPRCRLLAQSYIKAADAGHRPVNEGTELADRLTEFVRARMSREIRERLTWDCP